MALSDHEIEAYRETGFIPVRSALDTVTVETLRAEWRRLWDAIETSVDHRFVHWRTTTNGERVADRLAPVSTLSEVFRNTATSPALLGIAEHLLGGPAFVMKDKLISKLPETGGYDLHQDWPYWAKTGVGPEDFLTLAIALDPATPENGATAFYKGLHAAPLPADETGLDVDPTAVAGLEADLVTLAPGDAVCFHSLTPHQSRPNRSNSARRAWFITYARQTKDSEQIRARYEAVLDDVHKVHRRQIPG